MMAEPKTSELTRRMLFATVGGAAVAAGLPKAQAQQAGIPLDTPGHRVTVVMAILGQQSHSNLNIYLATKDMSPIDFRAKVGGSNSAGNVEAYRQSLNAWGGTAVDFARTGTSDKSAADVSAFQDATRKMDTAYNKVESRLTTGWISHSKLTTGSPAADTALLALTILSIPFYQNQTTGRTTNNLIFQDPRASDKQIDDAEQNRFVGFAKGSGAKVDESPRGMALAKTLQNDSDFVFGYNGYKTNIVRLMQTSGTILKAGGDSPTVQDQPGYIVDAISAIAKAGNYSRAVLQQKYPNDVAPASPAQHGMLQMPRPGQGGPKLGLG